MPRVLLLATTTGYQTRSFGEAAGRLGVELVFATDRCHMLEDPWQDHAIPIRFYDEARAVDAIVGAARVRPIDAVLVVGDRPTVIAARVAQALGLPGNPPEAAAIARHKLRTRECFRNAGLPVPWFFSTTIHQPVPSPQPPVPSPQQPATSNQQPKYPCVIKPVALSGSRGVMRADDPASLAAAFDRLRVLLKSPDIRAERDEAHESMLVEGFIPGREFALEGVLHHGALHTLAIFDKPDPLDGPFFEETLYVTPSSAPDAVQQAIVRAVEDAGRAIGLRHGPVHAECRVPTFRLPPDHPEPGRATSASERVEVFVLEVAARPIGGLCARALRFAPAGLRVPNPESQITLEELLLRHALGESPSAWRREPRASGVMMIPIPRRGIFRGVEGVDAAKRMLNIDDVQITAKQDQLLLPLPEGASYLGFIFARAERPIDVDRTLRAANAELTFAIDPEFPVLAGGSMRYNREHG
jgi:biotin carboxylase